MKTVLALIDHPNLDRVIVPVLLKLREFGIQIKVLIAGAGRKELCIKEGIPFTIEFEVVEEFLNLKGDKLFLNAADLYFDAHKLGRSLNEICRSHNIPSLTIEHGPFVVSGTLRESLRDKIIFSSDKMAVIGKADYEAYLRLGVSSDRLVQTGLPLYDEYFEFIQNKPFKKGNYIYFAGCNHPFVIKPACLYNRTEWTNLLKHIYEVLFTAFPDLNIVVKPHPAEHYHNTVILYEDAVNEEFRSRIRIVDPRDSNIELIYNSAFVFSFSASILLEAILLQKNTFYISRRVETNTEIMDAEKLGVSFIDTSALTIVSDLTEHLLKTLRDCGDRLRKPVNVSSEFMEKYYYKFDGKSSFRIAQLALSMMNEPTNQEDKNYMLSIRKEREYFADIGYERYQRLMSIAEEVERVGVTSYSLLDVGSYDDAFRRFVPNVKYQSYSGLISCKEITPFADNEFDIVVASDVLEHVNKEDRKCFILELVRIAKHKVIFSFPDESSSTVESFVLSLIPNHQWLLEHQNNKLPNKDEINLILDEAQLKYSIKPNHCQSSWLFSVLFDHSSLSPNIKNKVNLFFQQNFYDVDNKEPAYRYIYTLSLTDNFNPTRNLLGFEQSSSTSPQCTQSAYPTVSIIIPLFNNAELSANCIEKLFQNTPSDLYELILVDNGSTDRTEELLSVMPPSVKVIRNQQNQGFAKACNQGAQVASGKYLLFLNNDTEPLQGWLEPLVRILDTDPKVAVVGSKLLYPDNTLQHAGVLVSRHYLQNDLLCVGHIYTGEQADLPAANVACCYQSITAACLLIRKEVFETVGGFDEQYWNGFEDVDLCFKLRQAGWKLVYEPKSVLYHFESKSGPERFSKADHNGRMLRKRWDGIVKPDVIFHADGSMTRVSGLPYEYKQKG